MPKPKVSTTFNAVDKMKGPMAKMGRAVKGFTRVAAVGFGLAAAGIGAMVREASKIEDAVAGFTPLLGGVEKANKLVDMLNQTAATTPFRFDDISKASKQLLPVMNGDLERTVETFRMLGDTAGGNAQKLDSITRGFTKAMLKNKVDMESLNMIAEAGVPIYTELADSLGVTVAEMMDMSRAGKISSSDLEDAFRSMTKEGGVFFNGMEISSKTLTGKLSTLKDNIALTAAAIGKNLLPTIKPLVDKAIQAAGIMREWVGNNQELINQNIQNVFSKISNAVKILMGWLMPLVDIVINIGKEFIELFMNTGAGQKTIRRLGTAFEFIGTSIQFMWKIAKPIFKLMLVILEPILDIVEGIMKAMIAITNFATSKGSEGLSYAGGQQQAQAALMGRNDNVVSQPAGGNWQGNLNIKGLPAGSTMQSKGSAVPAINLQTAYGLSGL